jgi:4-hydroxybutyrate CoA-transferase
MVQMHPVDYTNNPAEIARNDNMVSINSTLQIDLLGQAASDTLGRRQFSGPGGQADFIRGAAWSRGGRSILALPSTAADGKTSRIVPHLTEGAAVTTTRTDIHYVVTEYGIADLWGRSAPERARRLTAIAHPDFRADLKRAWRSP